MSPIRLENVTVRLGQATILEDLSLDVPAGETLILLGRSGSGKTTALRLINRLIAPTSGQVRIEGKPTDEWDPIRLRRRIGYVIQEIGLFPHFTVEQNITLVPELEGWPKERACRRAAELIEQLSLPADVARRYPHQLSGGQRQRVGVARALAADPPILLMDEPFGALDPITRSDLQKEFRGIQRSLGKTIVFVTHDLREALLLGNEIALIEQGRLAWKGRATEFESAAHPALEAFQETLA